MNQSWPQSFGTPFEPPAESPPAPAADSLPTLKPVAEGRPRIARHPIIHDGVRSAPVLLSAAPCEQDQESNLLQPQTSFRFIPHPVDSTSGTCEVSIELLNKSTHIAHQPFICLTDLGLQLTPAENWSMDEIVSIRRMRRFSARTGISRLEPLARVHCCTISLLFSTTGGGFVEYEIGNWHPFETLPDLRISCVVGAGNYPSERLPITVKAESLRSFMRELTERGEVPAADAAEIAAAQ
jgi:hypothetical protein